MSILFSPVKIGPVTIKNRFMGCSVFEYAVNPDGTPKQKLLSFMEDLAKGEVGLVIPNFIQTNETLKIIQNQNESNKQNHTEIWTKAIQKIHEKGTKIFFQITHVGANALSNMENESPSKYSQIINNLKTSEIEDIIDSFHKKALLAKKIGADGVQLHGSNGILHSVFFSPDFNRRTDKYGGSIENRSRLVMEAAKAIRESAGPDFSITMKLNGNDFRPFGPNPDLVSRYITHLKKQIDMFEISCGNPNLISESKEEHFQKAYTRKFYDAFNISYAEFIKRDNPDIVIAVVGSLRTISSMEEAIKNKTIDIISLSKPLVIKPDLIKKVNQNI